MGNKLHAPVDSYGSARLRTCMRAHAAAGASLPSFSFHYEKSNQSAVSPAPAEHYFLLYLDS